MGKIFCLMGKSASGKDTVYKRILCERPELKEYVMYSTRPRRAGETDGVTYHFVEPSFIDEAEKKGILIERRIYNTVKGPWIYATIDDGMIDTGKYSYLMPATLESYNGLKAYFGDDKVVPVYIEVEDGERLIRAIRREQEQEIPQYREMCRRFLADCEDFSELKLKESGIEKRFVNSDLEECVKEILEVTGC